MQIDPSLHRQLHLFYLLDTVEVPELPQTKILTFAYDTAIMSSNKDLNIAPLHKKMVQQIANQGKRKVSLSLSRCAEKLVRN